jgi:hypothetical protein
MAYPFHHHVKMKSVPHRGLQGAKSRMDMQILPKADSTEVENSNGGSASFLPRNRDLGGTEADR